MILQFLFTLVSSHTNWEYYVPTSHGELNQSNYKIGARQVAQLIEALFCTPKCCGFDPPVRAHT